MRVKRTFILILSLISLSQVCCKKDATRKDLVPVASLKKILYEVRGTRFKLNYIDSNSVFQSNQVYDSLFHYEFWKGSGASIGITINRISPADTIYSWSLYIDDKLYANAFSEGGVYLTVPYN